VKDTWWDDRRTLEGELYAKIGLCEGVAQMHSYGVVQIGGEKDTTSSLIRRDLLHKGSPRAIDAVQNLEQDYTLNSPGNDSYPVTHYIVDYLPTILDENARPRGRTHSRLVMKMYGWPIKFAKSLLELFGAMRDAILGLLWPARCDSTDNVFHRAPLLLRTRSPASRHKSRKYHYHREFGAQLSRGLDRLRQRYFVEGTSNPNR
jgi:hypothetical protein